MRARILDAEALVDAREMVSGRAREILCEVESWTYKPKVKIEPNCIAYRSTHVSLFVIMYVH